MIYYKNKSIKLYVNNHIKIFLDECVLVKSKHETQLSRQITPRTKNGHAPPITQS